MSTITKTRRQHPWALVQKPNAWRKWARENPQERERVEAGFKAKTGIDAASTMLRKSAVSQP